MLYPHERIRPTQPGLARRSVGSWCDPVPQQRRIARRHLSVMDVLVVGKGGGLGGLVCAEIVARGHRVVSDAPNVVINCAGASVALALRKGWRGYRAVDVPIGLRAIETAKRHNARLVYVGVHHPAALRDTAYVDAHERVAQAMDDVDGCVVRSTGFFSAFAALAPMANRGFLVDVGDGTARTNPICEHDLAEIVVDVALGGDGPRDVSAGGPDVLSRREIMELVAAQANRRVRIAGVPLWLGSVGAFALRCVHPRIGQFAQFAVGLAQHDVIAPALGTTRLVDYLSAASRRDRPDLKSHRRDRYPSTATASTSSTAEE
jgi:uncharacterized protein YbjT (DUF2867 family)